MLNWIVQNRVGDLASIAGLFVTLLGFLFALRGIRQSKRAAEQARVAAETARESIRIFETVADFSRAIAILEEIKILHRLGQWVLLPEKYSAMRKILINVRSTTQDDLSEKQLITLQRALVNVRTFEQKVERALQSNGEIDSARFNRMVSDDIDALSAILAEFKMAKAG